MNNMFSGCIALQYLPDISHWDTENVIDLHNIFCHCNSLQSLPDISKWNAKSVKVEYMYSMFDNCSSLKSLPEISKWNIKKSQRSDFMIDKKLSDLDK